MMKKRKNSILAVAFLVFLTGCVTSGKKETKVTEEPSAAELSEAALPSEFIQKGREFEVKGDPVNAIKQYKLALTFDPQNQEAKENLNRLEAELQNLSEEHYQTGLKLHKEERFDEARKEFLLALRLWPDNSETIKMLTARERGQPSNYLAHTVKQGEGLPDLAKTYYGDADLYPLIAQYNDIPKSSKPEPGQTIKIPRIPGIAILGEKKKSGMKIPLSSRMGAQGKKKEGATKVQKKRGQSKEKKKAAEAQAAVFRDRGVELFNERKYQEAILELDKVLNVNPKDKIAMEYSFKSYFQYGVGLYEKKRYLAARDHFKVCLKYKERCQECHEYIRMSEEDYNARHYNKGMKYFDQEQVAEAIREWNLVTAVNPEYKKSRKMLERAKTIFKKLQELKKRQK